MGSRQHTFTIVFALKQIPPQGDCRLQIDLADTHNGNPAKLLVSVNGRGRETVLLEEPLRPAQALVVVLPIRRASVFGSRVVGPDGTPAPTQRLSDGRFS